MSTSDMFEQKEPDVEMSKFCHWIRDEIAVYRSCRKATSSQKRPIVLTTDRGTNKLIPAFLVESVSISRPDVALRQTKKAQFSVARVIALALCQPSPTTVYYPLKR